MWYKYVVVILLALDFTGTINKYGLRKSTPELIGSILGASLWTGLLSYCLYVGNFW